ncbi:MATE family efflux transporter [Bradyrhizobium sp. 137]|uniref:MATE family efflux transporter n=1 Tax=Bradyrhizobium sp. 137 TaxID=2782614 RepID=UPI0031FDE903
MDKEVETKTVWPSRYGVVRRAVTHEFVFELIETAKLALPMVLTQLGQVAMMTADLAFFGRLGADAVAAAALAGKVYFVGLTFCVGLLAASATFAAQAFGANNLRVVRRSLRMGLWIALSLSRPIMTFQLCSEQILLALSQAPDATLLAQQYLSGVAWGVALVLCFLTIRNFMAAVNRPEPVLWITLAAIPVNALLVYVWRVRPAAARTVRRGSCDDTGELCDVSRQFVVRHNASPIPGVPRSCAFLALRLAVDAAVGYDRNANFDDFANGVRNFLCRRPPDGRDQHQGSCGPPSRISGRGNPIHDPFRH